MKPGVLTGFLIHTATEILLEDMTHAHQQDTGSRQFPLQTTAFPQAVPLLPVWKQTLLFIEHHVRMASRSFEGN